MAINAESQIRSELSHLANSVVMILARTVIISGY